MNSQNSAYRGTGSFISGDGYHAAILRTFDCDCGSRFTLTPFSGYTCLTCGTRTDYAVELRIGHVARIQPVLANPADHNHPYNRAHELMTRFCDVAARWNRVKSTSAWLAADPSHAVIGTW